MTLRLALTALALAIVSTMVLLVNTAGHAIHNGDEAIYAEFAREMARTHDVVDLRWQGETQIVRPPLAVWTLALARVLLDDERAVRWPLALAAGAQVALIFLLAAALWPQRRWLAGFAAAGALVTADLFVGYARYLESEPFLCASVIASVLAWQLARSRPRFVYAWGAFLGTALMTKQIIGGLPLILPLIEHISVEEPRLSWRATGRGLLATAIVWLPWHVVELGRHGAAFVHSYLGVNVLERSHAGMLRHTRPTFYLRELWRSEGLFGAIMLAAAVWALVDGIRRRRRTDLLIAAWALGPLVAFSLAASRYDHYLLLAYPAFALAAAQLVTVRLPLRPAIASTLVAAWVLIAGALHLARDLSVFEGEDEVRGLMRVANELTAQQLYAYNLHAYAARYYLDENMPVTTLLESEDDFRIAEQLHAAGMPSSVALATDLPAKLASLNRPYLLLMPRARIDLLRGVPLRPVADSRHYVLYRSP